MREGYPSALTRQLTSSAVKGTSLWRSNALVETTVFPCGFLFDQIAHFFSSFSIGYLLSSASARGDNRFWCRAASLMAQGRGGARRNASVAVLGLVRAFDKKVEFGENGAAEAEGAQLVEHAAENRGVRSPILRLGTMPIVG